MEAEETETPPEEPKKSAEEAIEALNQALNDYYVAAGWDQGILTDSVIVSAQQIFTENGNVNTQVYVLPLGAIPHYRIVGLLDYAHLFYNAEVVAAHMPPPMLVQQFVTPQDFEGFEGEEDES